MTSPLQFSKEPKDNKSITFGRARAAPGLDRAFAKTKHHNGTRDSKGGTVADFVGMLSSLFFRGIHENSELRGALA